jgi:hypothetical protein
MNRILIIAIVFFVIFILNVVFLTIIYFIRRRMSQVSTWPSTMGTVVSSEIELRSDSDSGTTEYPAVTYSYQVNGQAYQNEKLAPGPEIGGSGARKVVAKYPAGAQVMVFYDPQKPSDAVLERNAGSALRFFWLFIAIFDCALCGALPIIWFSMGAQP